MWYAILKKERSLKNKQVDAFVREKGIQYKSGQFYGSEKISFKYKQIFLCILFVKYLHNMHNTPLLKIPLW